MKHIFLSLLLFFLSITFYAQDYIISGTIEDVETGETLLCATIYSKTSGQGTTTNEYGLNINFSDPDNIINFYKMKVRLFNVGQVVHR